MASRNRRTCDEATCAGRRAYTTGGRRGRIQGALLRTFRYVTLFEGVTTILLFLVAMPLKYLAFWPHLVPSFGWIHGLAFLAYLALMLPTYALYRVDPFGWLRTFSAALIPFGTFINARYVRSLAT